MSEPRRSSRANKGQHSARDLLDLYYVPEIETEEQNNVKRRKVIDPKLVMGNDDDYDYEDIEPKSEEGEVRCDPCGTTSANYNEEADEGGVMIECENCRTWQHAQCMGYEDENNIPLSYTCNRCAPQKNRKVEKADKKKIEEKEVAKEKAPKDKTRTNVCKALYNVILKNQTAAGVSKDEDAYHLAERMEEAIYVWSGTTDKKYIDKSRSVMALVKKPAVLAKAAQGSLAMSDLVLLPPEEIDSELKDYAEKVRQELIRRSVLTVEEDAGQRIRRTHKGEEIVETSSNSHTDDAFNVGIMGRNIDHRNFEKESSPSVIATNTKGPNLYQLDDEDEDDPGINDSREESEKKDDDSDDELDFILKGKKETSHEEQKLEPERKLPPMMPVQFWSGSIVFPDFVEFQAKAEFISCTNYKKPEDVTTVSIHNRAIRVCKEMFEKLKYLIEGRLDRTRADPYLSQVASSRDFYLVRLLNNDNADYEKLFEYLLSKKKVGVLSDRAGFVKDAYVFAIDGNIPPYMDFGPLDRGLYALFVVKKDYVPVGKSILKKSVLPPQSSAPPRSLDSILSKLGGSAQFSNPHILGQLNQELSPNQYQYVSDMMNQNPQMQNNPQALLNLLQNSQSGFH